MIISTRITHTICKILGISTRNTHEIHMITQSLHTYITHNALRDMCTFTHTLWYIRTRYSHPYIIAHGCGGDARCVQVYEVSHRIFFLISFSIRIRYWFSLSFSYWECYLVLLIIFHRSGCDEDFIVRTLELLTFIIASRPTISIGRVPLYKLVHKIPIRGEFGLY